MDNMQVNWIRHDLDSLKFLGGSQPYLIGQ